MSTSADKAWIVQSPVKKGSMKNLESYIKTGKICRDQTYQYVAHPSFTDKRERLTLEEAILWVHMSRKNKEHFDYVMRANYRMNPEHYGFDEFRLYNVFTGEIIPFAALLS